jgi:hypothetical protein
VGFTVSRLRLPVFALTLGLVLLVAFPALGSNAFQSGKYKGTTEQGEVIVFKATQGQVTKMRFTTVALCESGFGSKGTFSNLHAPIKNTRFEIKLTGNRGATTVTVKGRLTGPFAGGTIVDHTRVNPEKDGEPDPKGTDRCAATFHWAAEL